MIVVYIEFSGSLYYNIHGKRVPNTLLDVQYTALYSEDFAQLIHHAALVFHERMNIPVEGYGRILVSENFGQRLDIHPAFNRPGRKRMTDRMKATVRNPVFL